MTTKGALRTAHVALSFGLVPLIERFKKLDRRWKWAVWGLIIANEVRGLFFAWEIGTRIF